MATFAERIQGAAVLDVKTYEEVEADGTATGQAMAVVLLGAVSTGLASISSGAMIVALAAVLALVGWFVWATLTFLIGTKVMPEATTKADFGQLLRTIGFSASPSLLGVLGIIPFIGWVIGLVLAIWQLIAMVIAVRQALDFTSTARAVVVCLIGWVVYMAIWMSAAVIFGLLGVASGAFR